MDIHKNARLTPKGRERIVRQVLSGQTPKASARGLSANGLPGTASKVWRDLKTAARGRVGYASLRRWRSLRRSSDCAASA
jgi:hypothetical protein